MRQDCRAFFTALWHIKHVAWPLLLMTSHGPRGAPRIQHRLMEVIKPDDQALRGDLYPGEAMRGDPKPLLRVPELHRGQFRPTCPLDNLLVKTQIEVGLVMDMPRKIHLNVTLMDEVFELTPDKPLPVLGIDPVGAGRIMAEDKAPTRLLAQRRVRRTQLVEIDGGFNQTRVHPVDMQPGR